VVADPSTPNPTQVHHGALALTTALRISTLLPREQEAIFSILRSMNSADEQLRRKEGQPASDAWAASLLAGIVDNYRRALADLGR
jgi:hypothetical protein